MAPGGALRTSTVRCVHASVQLSGKATGCTRRGSDGSGPAARGCPAMLGRMAPSPNSLCSLRSRRSDSGDESEDEARRQAGARATRPALLGVADSPRRAQPAALPRCRWTSLRRPLSSLSRQAAPGRGDLWGAEKRSAAGGVRRAAPDRRGGSMRRRGSAVAEPPQPPRGASIAGQSRAAGPPQCEPLAGAACRDAMALKVRFSRHVSTSAMRRQRASKQVQTLRAPAPARP